MCPHQWSRTIRTEVRGQGGRSDDGYYAIDIPPYNYAAVPADDTGCSGHAGSLVSVVYFFAGSIIGGPFLSPTSPLLR